jgi:hypothetical protein
MERRKSVMKRSRRDRRGSKRKTPNAFVHSRSCEIAKFALTRKAVPLSGQKHPAVESYGIHVMITAECGIKITWRRRRTYSADFVFD